MAEVIMDVLRAQVVRHNVNQNWGFRLEGGADYGTPLQILRVTPASPADKIGVSAGDLVTEIGDIPTEGLTLQQAQDIVADFGDTILLTLERRARGAVPVNPVLAHKTVDGQDAIKQYQPLNMSGGGGGRKFNIVQSQPFHNTGPRVVAAPPQSGVQLIETPPPTSPTAHYQQQPAAQPSYETRYYQEDPYAPQPPQPSMQAPQSRTFQTIQNVMQYDVPSAGSAGLPPQRSVHMERFREEQAAQRAGSPRMRVLRAQQYNNPMQLYSAGNVMDTFQTQTSALLEEINKESLAPVEPAPYAVAPHEPAPYVAPVQPVSYVVPQQSATHAAQPETSPYTAQAKPASYRVTNTIQFSTNGHGDTHDMPKPTPKPYVAPSSQFMLPSQQAAPSPYSRKSPNRNVQQSTQAFSNLKIETKSEDSPGSYMTSRKTVEQSSKVQYEPISHNIEQSSQGFSDSNRSFNITKRVEKTSMVQYGEPGQIQQLHQSQAAQFPKPLQSIQHEQPVQQAYPAQHVESHVQYSQQVPVQHGKPVPHGQPVQVIKAEQVTPWQQGPRSQNVQVQQAQKQSQYMAPSVPFVPSQAPQDAHRAEQQAVHQIQVQHSHESRKADSFTPGAPIHIQPGQSVHIKQTSSTQRIEVKSIPNVELPSSMIDANASDSETTANFLGAAGLRPVPVMANVPKKPTGDDDEIKLYFTSVTVGSKNRIKQKQEQIFHILDAKKVPYKKIDIATDTDKRVEMREKAGNPSALPPVFVKGNRYLGGFDEFEYAVEMEDIMSFFK